MASLSSPYRISQPFCEIYLSMKSTEKFSLIIVTYICTACDNKNERYQNNGTPLKQIKKSVNKTSGNLLPPIQNLYAKDYPRLKKNPLLPPNRRMTKEKLDLS